VRGGVALNAGTHDGFQTQIAIDYIKYDDEESAVNFGLEFSWNRLLAISTGYQKDIGLMDQATFGLSLNLDDLIMPNNSPLPGRNNALRLDVASMDEGEFFSRTYRGGVSHYIIGPESFEFDYPLQHETITQDSLKLLWETSKDPDLYDSVNYHLLVSQDSSLIAGVLSQIKYDEISSSSIAFKEGILVSQQTTADSYQMQNLAGGDYYWSVVAYDKNDHYKLANRKGVEISHFNVPLPDLIVEKIEFEYFPWITTDEYQGKLIIQLRNAGPVAASDVSIFFHDSVTVQINNPASHESWAHTGFQQIDRIGPGQIDTLVIDWYRVTMGLCRISVTADAENTIPELDETNNEHVEYFYTIPKGTFNTGDVTSILMFQKAITEIPIINEVNFDVNSSMVPQLYMAHDDFVPPIAIIAERMRDNSDIKISLQGFSDKNSETATAKLANERAQAVKDKLLSLMVTEKQIVMKEGQVLAKRRVPVKAEDARWVFEERRKVQIRIIHDPGNLLYEPVPEIDEGHFAYPLSFDSKIRAAIPAEAWGVHLGKDADYFNYDLESMDLTSKVGVQWTTRDSSDFVQLIDKDVEYAITLTDTLQRTFRTKPQNTTFAKDETAGEHRFSFPLKFDDTNLLYNNYWQRIFDYGEKYLKDPSIRLRFDGHACAIGRAAYNLKLSEKRATTLKKKYESYLSEEQASSALAVKSKIKKTADGFGEKEAFEIINVQKPNKVIGDNEVPIGRKYNRRIEIIYYVPEGDQK
jgi:outer membrane protein OmpA-like peptidoglycan-associated protein